MFMTRQKTFFYGLVGIIEHRMQNQTSSKEYVSDDITMRRWILEAQGGGWRGAEIDRDAQNDVIQWIIDTSPKSNPWTPERMAFEVMAIWFGSVQGLATVRM